MPYKVKLTVVKQIGRCVQNHKEGDVIIFDGPKIIGNLCPNVLACFIPYIFATRFSARFPWFEDGKSFRFACPDKDNPVIFKIEPTGFSSEPFYRGGQELLLEKVKRKPGIKFDKLLDEFSEQEKQEYWFSQPKIQIFLQDLIEAGMLEIREGRVYPAST